MDHDFYFHRLYPFQDQVLKILFPIDTKFYLTGETALSRAYLNHRFSDDLDFFVNDDPLFLTSGVPGAWPQAIDLWILRS